MPLSVRNNKLPVQNNREINLPELPKLPRFPPYMGEKYPEIVEAFNESHRFDSQLLYVLDELIHPPAPAAPAAPAAGPAEVAGGELVNVKEAGAKGDGKHDDTEIIQATWNSLGTNDVLWFPPGTYLWDGSATPLTLDNGGRASIWGSGGSTRILFSETPTTNFFKVTNGRFWSIRDLNFSGPSATTPTAGAVIDVDSPSTFSVDAHISNITMRGGEFFKALKLWKVLQVYVEDFEVYGAQSRAFDILGGFSILCKNLYVNNMDKTGQGIRIAGNASKGGSEAVCLTNCLFANCSKAMEIVADNMTLGEWVKACKFVHCFFDDTVDEAVDINNALDLQFLSCYFVSASSFGCHVRKAEHIDFIGCNFDKNENHGLYVESTSQYINVVGGHATDNDDLDTGNLAGIAFEGGSPGAQHFTVKGVQVHAQTALYNKNQAYGIQIGTGCDNFILEGNNVSGNVTTNIFNNAGYGPTKIVKDNIGWVTENYGTANVSPDALGEDTIAHGLAANPSFVQAVIVGDTPNHADVESHDGTNITVRIKDSSGADVTTGAYVVKWEAKL